jgi:predicted RNA binding protein YcfA (HicA-like mRNA interferase family)
VPKKIRELKAMLLKAGFTYRPGKGSHTVGRHPLLEDSVTLSGQDGADGKRYQEKDIEKALKSWENLEEEDQ